MRVELIACTPGADAVCAAAGRSCYSEEPSSALLGSAGAEGALDRMIGMGHESVIEHACFTFSVEGVSRSLTHQLVRHRVASFSQQSQRYVPMREPSYVVPHTVEADPELLAVYKAAMDAAWEAYRRLSEKVPAEDARYALPNGCCTNITVTMNARELRHFFSLRCCNRAQWEIRELADRMLRICREASPAIFRDAGPPCVRGPCPEGRLSCGRPRTELMPGRAADAQGANL